MEQKLLAAFLKDAEVFSQVHPHLDLKGYSEEFGFVSKAIEEYYSKDAEVSSVDVEVLLGLMEPRLKSKKQFEFVKGFTEAAALMRDRVSAVNVGDLVLQAKKFEVGNKLAVALVENSKGVNELLLEYQYLVSLTDPAALLGDSSADEVFTGDDIANILSETTDESKKIKLFPKPLHEACGGVVRQNHILVYGEPEIGKSATWITMVGGFLWQGLKVLVIENEDATKTTYTRIISNVTQMTAHEMKGDMDRAIAVAQERGTKLLTVVGASPGTPQSIEALCERYEPDVLVVNQIHNVAQAMKGDNHVLKLLAISTFLRNLGKKRNMVVVSVTQGSDDCHNKAVLAANDVYFSNTAVPGAVDLMVGIGASADHMEQGIRVLSLPKNKLNANHTHFPTKIFPFTSTLKGVV